MTHIKEVASWFKNRPGFDLVKLGNRYVKAEIGHVGFFSIHDEHPSWSSEPFTRALLTLEGFQDHFIEVVCEQDAEDIIRGVKACVKELNKVSNRFSRAVDSLDSE